MKKRILTTLLCCAMALSMVACGGKEDPAQDTTKDAVETETTVETAEPETTETTETADTAAESGEAFHFEVLVKSFQSTYWQAAVTGIDQACAELGVTANCNGPVNESDIAEQVQMLDTVIANKPDGIALAACDTTAVLDSLAMALEAGIPVVCFDTGVEGAVDGAIHATVATDNTAAGACAATNMFPVIEAQITAATVDAPVRIGEVNQDAAALNIQQRGLGFVNRMIELCNAAGKTVMVEGNEVFVNGAVGAVAEGAEVIIEIGVPETTTVEMSAEVAKEILAKEDTIAIFGSNQITAEGIITANYELDVLNADPTQGIVAAGFDAGTPQKTAITDGVFLGSVTQSPLMMGKTSIQTLLDICEGKSVADVPMDGYWYDVNNIDADDIAPNLYD